MRATVHIAVSLWAAVTVYGCAATTPEARVRRACERSAVRVASKLKVDPKDTVWAVGAGVVVHESGYVLTCWHTLSTAGPKRVVFSDGEAHPARVVSAEKRMDIALLKIEAERTFAPAALADSDEVRAGDAALAKGNALGNGVVVTQGKVTSLNCGWGYFDFYQSDAIEFDAPIRPGNSGGPLFNGRGEVVGIISSKNYDIAGNEAYAVPINTVLKTLVEQLYADGRHYFVTGMNVPAAGEAGVAEVTDGSPAHKASIKPGDIITGIDGLRVARGIDYHIALIDRTAGEAIALKLRRGRRTIETTLTLGKIQLRPAEQLEAPVSGINFARYEGSWEGQPDFDAIDPAETGVSEKIDLEPCKGKDRAALRFAGYVRVPADGIYTFGITARNPARLLIGDELVVNGDIPGVLQERKGFIALAAGLHPITVTFIKKNSGGKFDVTWTGPKTKRQPIPGSALYRDGSGAESENPK